MKAYVNVALLSVAAFLLIASCNDEKDPVINGIKGNLVHNSECKTFNSGNRETDTISTLSCVHYTYNTTSHVIIMKHFNAGFNCCPIELYCEVTVAGDTIIISESEKEQNCNCLCLFDLDIELQNINPDKYIVKFIEPYAEGMPPLIFEMDLTENDEGEYCIYRERYPWGS
jgi:hypothetical protein